MTIKDIIKKIDEFNKKTTTQEGRITNQQKQYYKDLLKIYNELNNELN